MKATTILFGIFLAVSTLSFAGNGDSAVDKIISKKIAYPESLRSKGIEATVQVKLKINEEGKLEIVSIQSDSEEMKAAVERQVNKLKYKANSALFNQEFDYTFKFKLQD